MINTINTLQVTTPLHRPQTSVSDSRRLGTPRQKEPAMHMLALAMRILKRNLATQQLIRKRAADARALKHAAHRLLGEAVVLDAVGGAVARLRVVRHKVEDEEAAAGR